MSRKSDNFKLRLSIPLTGTEFILFSTKNLFAATVFFCSLLIFAFCSFSAMTAGSKVIIGNVVGSGGGNSTVEATGGVLNLYSVSGQAVEGGTSEASGLYLLWAGNIYTLTGVPVSISTIQIPLIAGFNLFSLPVIPDDTSISSVIGNQLEGKSARIYSYSPVTGWSIAYAQDGTWSGSLAVLEPDKGYWIKVSSAATPEIAGNVSITDRTITLKGQKPNLIGTAYNTSRTMAQTGLGPYLTSSDRVWGYVNNVWKPAYYSSGSWGGALASFEAGRGYWIIKNSAGEVDWVYPKP